MNETLSKETIRQAHVYARSATTILMESFTTDDPLDMDRVHMAAQWLRQALDLVDSKTESADYLSL
jgi:hypothetical protein